MVYLDTDSNKATADNVLVTEGWKSMQGRQSIWWDCDGLGQEWSELRKKLHPKHDFNVPKNEACDPGKE